MKRLLSDKRTITRYTEKIDIDIFFYTDRVESSESFLDTNSPEYLSFVESMVATFTAAGYELSNNPDWTHKSNKGSESWYYTFIKTEGDVEVKVVVNVRVSDHLPSDRPWATQSELRERYISRLGEQVAQSRKQKKLPFTAGMNVVIDGKIIKSYYSAVFYVKRQLELIEEAVEEYENQEADQ